MSAMTNFGTWYNNQYAGWNRTRRLQTAPFLARAETNTSRTATALARQGQDNVPLNMVDKNERKADTLFGPNIGVVSSGPAWTQQQVKKSADELTPEIVQSWIAKSKETSQPTTTLQALVNLKRPTLRLTPLDVSSADDPDHADSQHHHGLEFEYDCDAPKCAISAHVVLSPDHHLAEKTEGFTQVTVFETTTDGGFARYLKLEEGAILELGRFEHGSQGTKPIASEDPAQSTTSVNAAAEGQSTPTAETDSAARPKKRFSTFHFRKREHGRSISGPALAVVDAQPAVPPVTDAPEAEQSKDKDLVKSDGDDHEGVKVAIKLVALDEQGQEMSAANEQVTYLHIVRLGQPPAQVEGAQPEEDKRPWVVKVVKREATIGPHTFHLHEIYGLSSYSSAPSHPVDASASPTTHTYPPAPSAPEDEPSSECLVCLSSPREVVLLPCRHLVACKECAINMVEFGAGGAIVHNDISDSNGATDSGADATAGATAGTDGVVSNGAEGAAAAPQPNPRRKRKAKGWFCPVCRQPYTSLLRITTAPPATLKESDKTRDSTSTEGPEEPETESPAPMTTNPASRNPLASFANLRNLSFRGAAPASTLPPDLERGQVPLMTTTTSSVA